MINNMKEEQNSLEYSPFNLFISEAKDAETVILLLQSENKSTLLAAVEALSKYASKSKDNAKILFHLGIVNNILPIIEHEDIYIRRFAGKLLTEMIAVPDVKNYLIESDRIEYFTKLLMSEKDTFMQEYLSAMLAKLSEDPYGNALLAKHCSNVNFLFEVLQSSDPDVKKHSLEILHNLMQDPVAAREISKNEKFSFPLLYQHFESSYPEIQYLALDVIADIIGRNKDEEIQSLFHETNGVKVLLDFLKNDEYNDSHIKALEVLRFAVENLAVVDELIDSGSISQIVSYIKYAKNPRFFTEALRIVVYIANTSNGRKVLHSYGIIECLLNALQQSMHIDIVEVACYGIGEMTLNSHAAKEFASTDSIKTILDILKKEDLQWSTRHAASFAIKRLLMSDIKNCDVFLNIHGPDYLWQLLKHFTKQVSVETCIIALEALLTIARHPTLRDILINFNSINTICSLLESTYPFIDEFKIACCKLFSALCLEENGRHYFLKANGPQRIFSLITDSHPISIRNATLQFVQAISTDLSVAKAFVENKYLSYMLNNRSCSRAIPLWDTCVEILLKSNLPIKFALTGRLSVRDLTQDGFYVSKITVCSFPVLDDIFRFKFCPLKPIYVVNCMRLPTSSTLQSKTVLKKDINAWLELKFGQLQCDPDFVEYVELFKRMLSATESKVLSVRNTDIGSMNVQYVPSRAKMLARFVARQMSGVDSTVPGCFDRQLEVHLKRIKECLETSVIPLGQLRVGSYLERALLFKAIADRICLPAALMEASNEGGLFNDVLDKNNEYYQERVTTELLDKSTIVLTYPNGHERKKKFLSDCRSVIYPIKLLKPNFIVDLMDTPGDLIPIGSPRSKLYCIKKITNSKTCYY
ncbi:PREDICTED: armadillo repeat-containing protein 3 isoform X2 [Wasmannia auropunctata]|uniref:armadillo repeat-containing protein 3 isoform X2 n=1 Tax=Wasmannia auropunctata TaxID=64793 RepID=UPI0005EDAC9B|nr:PREDICTED: armadillo repeat-containing protein 3 isoform X2 [Wasmannia auropunctata]